MSVTSHPVPVVEFDETNEQRIDSSALTFALAQVGEIVRARFDGEWRSGCKVARTKGKCVHVRIPEVLDDVYGLHLLKEGEEIPERFKPKEDNENDEVEIQSEKGEEEKEKEEQTDDSDNSSAQTVHDVIHCSLLLSKVSHFVNCLHRRRKALEKGRPCVGERMRTRLELPQQKKGVTKMDRLYNTMLNIQNGGNRRQDLEKKQSKRNGTTPSASESPLTWVTTSSVRSAVKNLRAPSIGPPLQFSRT